MSTWEPCDEADLRAQQRREREQMTSVVRGISLEDFASRWCMPKELTSPNRIDILPGAFAIIQLKEPVKLPEHIGGIMGLRKTYGAKKLMIGSTIIEPGYDGYLELQLLNLSDYMVEIKEGDALVNVLYVHST